MNLPNIVTVKWPSGAIMTYEKKRKYWQPISNPEKFIHLTVKEIENLMNGKSVGKLINNESENLAYLQKTSKIKNHSCYDKVIKYMNDPARRNVFMEEIILDTGLDEDFVIEYFAELEV